MKTSTYLFIIGCLFVVLGISLGMYTHITNVTDKTAPLALLFVALLFLQTAKVIDKHGKGEHD